MRFRCLLTALVLLAAFASDSWGQSKQPSPKASPQKATQQEPGSEDCPVVVKVIPTEKSKDELARQQAQAQENATLSGDLAFYTKQLIIATATMSRVTL